MQVAVSIRANESACKAMKGENQGFVGTAQIHWHTKGGQRT